MYEYSVMPWPIKLSLAKKRIKVSELLDGTICLEYRGREQRDISKVGRHFFPGDLTHTADTDKLADS